MRIDIIVENGRTGVPIDGATVTVSAEDIGTSEEEQESDLEENEGDKNFVESVETVSNEEYNGRAAFELASWVTEAKIEVSHERFETATQQFTPGLTDTQKKIELTPELADVSIFASEYFPEPAEILIKPADEVLQKLYSTETTVEIAPGETPTFSFIEGRYKFEIQNPPENYTGEIQFGKNLEMQDSPQISFSGMDLDGVPIGPEGEVEHPEDETAASEDEQQEESSLAGKFKELLSDDDTVSDPVSDDDVSASDPVTDPVAEEDLGDTSMSDEDTDPFADDGADEGTQEELDAEAESEPDVKEETEDESDGEDDEEPVGLGALFN